MNEVTLNDIIRRYLAMKRLPLHYYLNALLVAKQGLDEMHFDTLNKVKYAVLPVTNHEITLPADLVDVIDIGIEVGDKVRKLGFNRSINPRDNSGQSFEITTDQYGQAQGIYPQTDFVENYYNNYGSFNGKQFGRNTTFEESYTVNLDLGIVRIDNKMDDTELLLIYLSKPEKVSNQSVIHSFAQRALLEFIGWQMAYYFNEKDAIAYKRNEFYNEYRKLRARMNRISTTEMVRSIRKKINLTVKN